MTVHQYMQFEFKVRLMSDGPGVGHSKTEALDGE